MVLSREEVEQIASAVAERVSERAGMSCSCKDIHPFMLQSIERDILGTGREAQEQLMPALERVARACHYEKDPVEGWVQFPKQKAALERFESYKVEQEHDDGDLTIRDHAGRQYVVTTDGRAFKRDIF